jgi:phytoene/squalene synthetase
MAGEAWLKGTVPHAYAARTLRTAEETLEDEARTIQEDKSQDAAELRASLAGHVRGVSQVVGQMRAAIESRDAPTLDGLLKQLEAGEQKIKALAGSGGAQP